MRTTAWKQLWIGLLFLALPAWGGELSPEDVAAFKSAKAAGTLREGGRGYLEAGAGSAPEQRALMERVNTLRRERYQELAQRQGVPLEAVENTAASRLTTP